jgi:hypothetical protein
LKMERRARENQRPGLMLGRQRGFFEDMSTE